MKRGGQPKWTEEQIAEIIQYRNSGLSATRIVYAFYATHKILLSRNAVLGIIDRAKRRGTNVIDSPHHNGSTVGKIKENIKLPEYIPAKRIHGNTKRLPGPEMVRAPEPLPLTNKYVNKWTCQWINDDNSKCDAECFGIWCDYHKQIVYKQKEAME